MILYKSEKETFQWLSEVKSSTYDFKVHILLNRLAIPQNNFSDYMESHTNMTMKKFLACNS